MKRNIAASNDESIATHIQSLQSFCRGMGITAITAWRYRKRGWLQTVNIAGRQYVTGESVATFKRRAEAGEFSKEHQVPRRNKAVAV